MHFPAGATDSAVTFRLSTIPANVNYVKLFRQTTLFVTYLLTSLIRVAAVIESSNHQIVKLSFDNFHFSLVISCLNS